MHLPLSRSVAPHLELLPEIGSTNAELAARASGAPQPHFSVLATTSQTAGKGRLGRTWVAPPGKTIAVSVLLKPDAASSDQVGWLPLLAGVALTRAVASLVEGHHVTLKWPNDVQVDGLKVSGVLSELVPSGVIIGAGLNLTMAAEELPTPTSTSLSLMGVPEQGIVDAALAAYLGALKSLYDAFATSGFDATQLLAAQVAGACSTIGRSVRVELPGGAELYGTARGIDGLGRLEVESRDGVIAVAAGDVTHLRYD